MTRLTRIVYSSWLLSALAFGAEKAVPPTFTPPDLELIHPVYYPPDSPEHPNNRAKLEGLTAHVARRLEMREISTNAQRDMVEVNVRRSEPREVRIFRSELPVVYDLEIKKPSRVKLKCEWVIEDKK